MKSILTNVLSREEMKEVMAGSGGGSVCNGWRCTTGHLYNNNYNCVLPAGYTGCRCQANLNELCGYA